MARPRDPPPCTALASALAALGGARSGRAPRGAARAGPKTWVWPPTPSGETGAPPRLAIRCGPPRDPFLAAAARAGVGEAWYVDPSRGWTERYRAPRDGAYRWRDLVLPGEALPLPGAEAAVVPLPL